MPGIQALVNDLVTKLQKRKIEGSNETARMTAELLRSLISQQRLPPTDQAAALIEAVRDVGVRLIAANPVELAVGNIVRRVLRVVRDEDFYLMTKALKEMGLSARTDYEDMGVKGDGHNLPISANSANGLQRPPSLHAVLERSPELVANSLTSTLWDGYEGKGKSTDKSTRTWKVKSGVIEALNDLIEDINTCHELISEQAMEIIHQSEVILTFGRSRTVKEFLLAAKVKKRSFQVFVAEGGPKYEGQLLAKELAARGLQTTAILDAAVFAMISRVNMVIVGVHAVMANGGVIGPVGLNMVALAAKRHAVPFVVVAGTHKLCPLHPHNPEVLLNEMRSSSELLDFGEFSDLMEHGIGTGAPLLHVVNPAFDYVPPELVSLVITEIGGHKPSYIHQLMENYYSADDFTLQQQAASSA
ncbi:hypothetical protein SLE2022_167670 [Rubroshorea leprosula]